MCTVACSLVCVYAVILSVMEYCADFTRGLTSTFFVLIAQVLCELAKSRKVSQSLAKYLCDQYTGTSIVNVNRQSGKRLRDVNQGNA